MQWLLLPCPHGPHCRSAGSPPSAVPHGWGVASVLSQLPPHQALPESHVPGNASNWGVLSLLILRVQIYSVYGHFI